MIEGVNINEQLK